MDGKADLLPSDQLVEVLARPLLGVIQAALPRGADDGLALAIDAEAGLPIGRRTILAPIEPDAPVHHLDLGGIPRHGVVFRSIQCWRSIENRTD